MEEEGKSKEIIPTSWFEIVQIETWVGESPDSDEPNGGRAKLIVNHQCGNNKTELISQLECLIDGLKNDFDYFAS